MNNLKWMGHSTTIFDIQKNLRDDPASCDVTLSAKGHSVRAHRFVLCSCSDLLRALLAEVPNGEETTIVIPDIKGILLETVLAFIYMGETSLSSTNLSEFLEAINILGIKSAISFECNTATLASAAGTSQTLKTIAGIPIVQEELIEQDNNMVTQKIETQTQQNVISDQQSSSRDMEFLDVYNEPQHKITYFEHVAGSGASANEFILTENSGTFTLTQNAKLETTTSSDCGKMDETEDDVDADSHIIEEYSSGGEPIIEVDENGATAMSTPTTSTPIIQLKKMMQVGKIKVEVGDPLNTPTGSYAMLNNSRPFDSSLSAAVDAVILEGLSLQKAAHKYEISKTVLWRRVRQSPKYMKMPRENPVLSLAYERLKAGEPLKSISRELEIPMSTLHRHKVRLAQQGRLPEYVTFKKRDSITREELRLKLAKAVHACVHEGMSQNHAANIYDIPKSTLWRHLQKRVAEAELSQSLEGHNNMHNIHNIINIKEEVILS